MDRTAWTDREDLRLLHGNGNRRGKLNGTGTSVNGESVAGGVGSIDGAAGGVPAAGTASDDHRSQNARSQNSDHALALNASDKSKTEQTEAEQPNGEEGRAPLAMVRGCSRSGGNGEDGADSSGARNDGSGRERTGQTLRQAGAGQGNGAVESA